MALVNNPPVAIDPVPVAGHLAFATPPRHHGLNSTTGAPPDLVREECTQNGFEFVREENGFDRPQGDGGGHFFFLIFRKPR